VSILRFYNLKFPELKKKDMKQQTIRSLSIGSMTAALYVTIILFTAGISHWFGVFLLPFSILFGTPFAVGMGIGGFLSTFIMPRDPGALFSAVTGGLSNFIASYACYYVYKHLKLKKENIRIQISCLVASILVMLIDGSRTLISWWVIGIYWPITYVWIITLFFSLVMINIFGFALLIKVKKLFTTAELKRGFIK